MFPYNAPDYCSTLMFPTDNPLQCVDLVEWMRRLSIELIRQSPSPIIRACATLAKVTLNNHYQAVKEI